MDPSASPAAVTPTASAVGREDAAAVPAFRPGGSFSVGVEEELMLVDGAGELLGAAAAPLIASLVGGLPAGVVKGEIYVDQVELNSPVCDNAEDVIGSLRTLRAWVADRGASTMAVGVHPTAPLGGALIACSARYEAIANEFAGLLRTPTAAMQVHLGLPDPDTMMLAYRGLRARMPLIRALASSSPYWHGQDSGLASARSAILRSYPRTTVPPLLSSWEEYVSRIEGLMKAAEVRDHTFVWWDMRPRPLLGTLEVRVMDAQSSLSRVAGLTALVQGIARYAVDRPDMYDLSDEVVAVNDHRVVRHGLDARIVDVDGTMRPLREIAGKVLAQARSALVADGVGRPLDVIEEMLGKPDEPARQRHVVRTRGMPALLADLVARTTDMDG